MTSKSDQARLDALHDMPCICCELEDERRGKHVEQPNKTTAHHLVDLGTRELSGGHQATLPMCEYHHLGYRHPDYDKADMEAKWGPSLALKKKKFLERYGTERELLKIVNDKFEAVA